MKKENIPKILIIGIVGILPFLIMMLLGIIEYYIFNTQLILTSKLTRLACTLGAAIFIPCSSIWFIGFLIHLISATISEMKQHGRILLHKQQKL